MGTNISMILKREGVSAKHRREILAYLNVLGQRDEKTKEHSVRVGVCACEIAKVAKIPNVTPRMLLWAGLLHDIGKIPMPPELLRKAGAFTPEDYAKMEEHVLLGWRMLQKSHDFTAHILVRHHQFGPKPYPKVLPSLPNWLRDKKPMIEAAARLLALADYYDALTTRQNAKFGKALNLQEKRKIFYRDNADQKELAERLEAAGIFKF